MKPGRRGEKKKQNQANFTHLSSCQLSIQYLLRAQAMKNKIILLNFLTIFPDRCRIIPPSQIWVKVGQKRVGRP